MYLYLSTCLLQSFHPSLRCHKSPNSTVHRHCAGPGRRQTYSVCLQGALASGDCHNQGRGREKEDFLGRVRSRGRGAKQSGRQRGLEFRVQVPAWWRRRQGPGACCGVWTYKGKPWKTPGRNGRTGLACWITQAVCTERPEGDGAWPGQDQELQCSK